MYDNILGLFAHNLLSYSKISEAYKNGEKIVGILHATGTGKTLNALQLAYDNKEKNIIYLVPSNGIIEHIKELCEEIPGISFEKDFSHVNFMTYSSLVKMSKSELSNLGVDLLILDEFHHIGAPVWGDRVNTIIETHPDMLVFGMSAYSVRDRNTPYERDLAEDDSLELFSGKIVSRYDLVDAMRDSVLPIPIYRSAHIQLLELEEKLEYQVKQKCKDVFKLNYYIKLLHDVKRKISESLKVNELLLRNVRKDGKYIYFCPPCSEKGINDIETIMNNTRSLFIENGFNPDDICFYFTTSEDFENGKLNRKCFYNDTDLDGEDVSNKLRIIFAINQYNEGIHAPNVDGVILGRETSSDIVYFEQIGRALSVRGDTVWRIAEYKKLSLDELKKLCLKNDILINDDMSKDEIISRLVAPKIIDLVGNYSFIKDLFTDLKHRLRNNLSNDENSMRLLNLTDCSFDIEILGHDLFNTLMDVKNEFLPRSWNESYTLALNYYNKYKNLNIKRNFKTDDGINYEEYGFALGEWIIRQRRDRLNNKLDQEQINKLNMIGMIWSTKKIFMESYELAKNYYSSYGNLKIKYNFSTNDGVNYLEDGYSLGYWIVNQRRKYRLGRLGKKEINLLNEIGMVWSTQKSWDEAYLLAKNYYNVYGNLNMGNSFCTFDGKTLNENGYNLGSWVYNQKKKYHNNKLNVYEIGLLEDIGICWDIKEARETLSWDENYLLARNFFYQNNHLNIVRSFKTFDGITYDEDGYNLGSWISRMRVYRKKGKLDNIQITKLNEINMIWNEDVVQKSWEEAYLLAKNYYLENGNLAIKSDFKTIDGFTYDSNGYNLGSWIYLQRNKYNNEELSADRIVLLDNIGMIWNINKNYADIKELLKANKINPRKYARYVKHLSYREFEAKVRFLLDNGYSILENGQLHEIFNMSSIDTFIKYGINREDLVSKYSLIKRSK